MSNGNKSLALLLIATLFVSVFGLLSILNKFEGLESMTGAWGQGGSTRAATNLSIETNLVVNFSDDSADFGTGYIRAGYSYCVIATDGTNTSGCENFNVPDGLILENIGNTYAKINLTNSNYTSSMLGGTSGYAWKWELPEDPGNNETCSPTNQNLTIMAARDQWQNITMLFDKSLFCDSFNFSDQNDIINISIKLHIDQSTYKRTVSDTWLIEAIQA